MLRLRLLLPLILLSALPGRPLVADTLTGEVRGTVRDVESGLSLQGVTVVLLNVQRGWEKQLVTDARGNYLFIQLEPGNYTVTVRLDGYYESSRSDVLIRLNQPKVVVPAFELRRLVATPTREITLRGEQTKRAIIDLTATGPAPVILAVTDAFGETSMVSLQDWALRFNWDTSLLRLLPLRGGRTFDQLALTAPGVFRVPFTSGEGPAVGIGVGTAGQFAVNGFRGRSNNFSMDGSDNNDDDIGVRRQGFVALVPQNVESIEELQVISAGAAAEFGRNAGAMVNAVTRSGTQKWHGSLFTLLNQDHLNARNFFESAFEDQTNSGDLNGGRFSGDDQFFHQSGGEAGGALVADRLFFFASAQREDRRGTEIGHFVVPTSGERGLRTSSGFVPIESLDDFFDQREIAYSNAAGEGIFSLYPLPNNPLGPFGEHTFSQAVATEAEATIFALKTDWYITGTHSLTSRYSLTDDERLLPFTSGGFNSTLASATRTQNLALFLNSTTPTRGNALRASYGRTALRFPPEKSSPFLFGSAPSSRVPGAVTQLIRTPYGDFGPFGVTGPIGQLSISPYDSIGVDVFNFPQGRVDNTFQISDAVTWNRTRHTLKAGVDIRRYQLNSFADRNSRPLLQFAPGLISSNCLANPFCPFATPDGLLSGADTAALGAPAGLLQTISTGPAADTTIGLRFTSFDFFVQDDWSPARNLTLNLGLRYELQTVPRDVNRRVERTFGLGVDNFQRLNPGDFPAQSDQNIVQAGNQAFERSLQALLGFSGGRDTIYRLDSNNFAPRLGFAWDPSGAGRLVVRAGYGIFYDANLGAVTSQSRNVFPTFAPVNLDPNFLLPTGQFINTPALLSFRPTGERLIAPGTVNTFNLSGPSSATGLGTLFVQAPPFPGGSLSSNGLAFTLPEPNLKTAYGQHFVLSMQHQFARNFLAGVSYVGTRGSHLTRFRTPNGGLISTPILLFPGSSGGLTVADLPPRLSGDISSRPVANLGAFTLFENSAPSNYHSLQTSLEKRFSRGLQFQLHWTWAHAIDEVSDPFEGRGFSALPQDVTRLDLEKGSASFDVRHRVSWFLVWDVPDFLENSLSRNWRISLLGETQTGQPFTVRSSLDRNLDGNLTDRPQTVAPLLINPRRAHLLQLPDGVSPLDLLAPRGVSGAVGRNTFRGDGLTLLDAALSRRIPLRGDSSLDFRLEVFNIMNNVSFGFPVRILESPGFGRAFDTQAEGREMRLAVQFRF